MISLASGLHSSQDARDIVVDRPPELLAAEVRAAGLPRTAFNTRPIGRVERVGASGTDAAQPEQPPSDRPEP